MGDELKQYLRLGLILLDVVDVIDDHDPVLVIAGPFFEQCQCCLGLLRLLHQMHGADELAANRLFNCRQTD